MRCHGCVRAAIGMAMVGATACSGAAQVTSYDNFRKGASPYAPARSADTGATAGTTWGRAYRFTPYVSGVITGIDVGVFTADAGSAGATFKISVLTAIDGWWPGEEIGYATFDAPYARPTDPSAPYRITPIESIELEAGTPYWLAVTDNGSGVSGYSMHWYHGDDALELQGWSATLREYPFGFEWGAGDTNRVQGGFRVFVPAPGAGTGIGVLVMVMGRRRRCVSGGRGQKDIVVAGV